MIGGFCLFVFGGLALGFFFSCKHVLFWFCMLVILLVVCFGGAGKGVFFVV